MRNRSPEVLRDVPMAVRTSGDSTLRVSGIIFRGFTSCLRLGDFACHGRSRESPVELPS